MTDRPLTRRPTRIAAAAAAALALTIVACQLPRPSATAAERRLAITPDMDFVQYRWVAPTQPSSSPYVDPAGGDLIDLENEVVLDVAGFDSAWVATGVGPAGGAAVVVRLNATGASGFGAATATHVGRRIAVLLDGRVATIAAVNSPLGPIVPLVTDVPRPVADSLASRLTRAITALRPLQPAHFDRRVSGAQAAPGERRAIVRLNSLGLFNTAASSVILVFSPGRASVGIAGDEPQPLTDTLQLKSLPALTLDVTEADVHLQLRGPGYLSVAGEVRGGTARSISAKGTHLVLLRGGVGVALGSTNREATGGQ